MFRSGASDLLELEGVKRLTYRFQKRAHSRILARFKHFHYRQCLAFAPVTSVFSSR